MGLEHKTGDHKNKSGTKKPKNTEEKIIDINDQSSRTGDHKNKHGTKKSKNTEEKIIDTNDQSNNPKKSKTCIFRLLSTRFIFMISSFMF
jgi:hypothetical protein